MAPRRHLVISGQFIRRDQIHQVTIETEQNPLTATILMRDGSKHHYYGEDADAVRAQSKGLLVVTARPPEQVAIKDLPEEIRRQLLEAQQPQSPDNPEQEPETNVL